MIENGEKKNLFHENCSREKYADIIDMPHHVSRKRTPMSVSDRAAQFAPFAALTGHEEAMARTAEQVKKMYDK